jgi:hypothetical protein
MFRGGGGWVYWKLTMVERDNIAVRWVTTSLFGG